MRCENMNRRRRKLIIVLPLACAGVIALFVWKSFPPSEPVYRGKLLRVWLDEWRANEFPTTNSATRSEKAKQEAADAVHALRVQTVVSLVVQAIVGLLTSIACVLVYWDLRRQRESIDIDQIAAVFD